jgi:predicted dinucleotide-binding enzyme
MVGQALATRLAGLGHQVMMGSRTRGNEKALDWVARSGADASAGSFADAAGFGEVIVNATGGVVSLAALEAAGADAIGDKVLIDVSNAIAPDSGMPPALSVCNTDSLAEQIQRALPRARVVKTLNTVNAAVMVDPASIPGAHNVFVCGNDAGAKRLVTDLLVSFGWSPQGVIDLGDITRARGPEMYLALWVELRLALGTNSFNIEVRPG